MEKAFKDNIPIIEEVPGKGYWEIYKDSKIWHENPTMKFKSHQQIEEEAPKFALLPHDDYKLVITEIKSGKQKKYMKPEEEEEVIEVVFDISGLRDGGKAIDIDGQEATNRKAFFNGRPESMGFMKDGTPAKTRQFVAYSTKQDIEGELNLESWEELLGKTICAEIVQYTNQKGQKRNKISRFLFNKKK